MEVKKDLEALSAGYLLQALTLLLSTILFPTIGHRYSGLRSYSYGLAKPRKLGENTWITTGAVGLVALAFMFAPLAYVFIIAPFLRHYLNYVLALALASAFTITAFKSLEALSL